MKKTFLSLAIAGLLTVPLHAMADQAKAVSAPLLFVQTAQTASLTPDAKTPHAYTLTLSAVNPQVLWFTDRPGRTAGSLGMKNFVAAWSNSAVQDDFKIDHPNAALLSVSMEQEDSAKEVAPVFTLSQPAYDTAHKTMTYHAVLVKGSDTPLKMNLKDVALFVDGVKPPMNAQGQPIPYP